MSKDTVRAIAADFGSTAIPSLIVALFWLLESLHNHIPITVALGLFLALLWLVQTIFCVAIMPVFRYAREADANTNAMALSMRVIAAGFLLALWTGLLVHHVPCFLANCG